MAGVDLSQIRREEVGNIVRGARNAGKEEKTHLKSELTKRYPGIENATVRRNGRVYPVLDYIAEDSESYGSSP